MGEINRDFDFCYSSGKQYGIHCKKCKKIFLVDAEQLKDGDGANQYIAAGDIFCPECRNLLSKGETIAAPVQGKGGSTQGGGAYSWTPIPMNSQEKRDIVSGGSTQTGNANQQKKSNVIVIDENGIATLLKVLAVIVYICAFIAGIALGRDLYGDFSFWLCLLYWVVGLFSGSLLLGFSEVVRLLHEIRAINGHMAQ